MDGAGANSRLARHINETTIRSVFASLKGVHQREGVRWMCRRETHPGVVHAVRGGFLADGMGLGKTYQVSALLRLRPMPTLVVVTLSTLMQWQAVLTSHGRGLPFVLRGKAQAVLLGEKGFEGIPTVLTTYSIFSHGIDGVPLALRRRWGRIVLDEGHVIRNPKSNLHSSLCKIGEHAVHRWVLTGTPVNNSLGDLNSLVAWLGAPGLSIGLIKEHLILRRTLELEAARSPEFKLPGMSIIDSLVELGQREREIYDIIEASGRAHAAGSDGHSPIVVIDRPKPMSELTSGQTMHFSLGDFGSSLRAMEAVLRCRQACTHMSLLGDAVLVAGSALRGDRGEFGVGQTPLGEALRDPRVVTEATLHPIVAESSSRIRRLVELVSSHKDEKTLVFCDWIKEMDIIEEALTASGAVNDVVRYQGSMDLRERECALRSFGTMAAGSVMIAQIQCGGTGLNIQSASRVYLMRPAWNPCVEKQAIGRAYRLGQTRHVTVTRLVAVETVDVRCLEIQSRKLSVIDKVMNTGEAYDKGQKSTREGRCVGTQGRTVE